MEEKEPVSHSKIFLFLFTNITFLWVFNVLWLLSNIYVSIRFNNWHWFERSGSVTIIIGAILISRNVLRISKEERKRFRNMTIVERFSDSEKEDQDFDSLAIILGVVLMIMGTLIWAYSDAVIIFFLNTFSIC